MNRTTWLAIQLYSWLIRLYPASFREEFGAEMTAVFVETITEAARVNRHGLLVIFLRELHDYPFSLLRQHWRIFTHSEPNLMTMIRKPEWPFYPAWIILTVLCVPIAFILRIPILRVIVIFVSDFIYMDGVRYITEDYLGIKILIPLVGLLTGVLQYGLLRRYLQRMGWWALATTGGWLMGLLLVFGWLNFRTYESFDMDVDFSLIVLGLSIGVGQWLLLRRRLSRAGWWIGANVVGWGLMAPIIGDPLQLSDVLTLGLLPACVTAATLALLMNQAQLSEMCSV